MFKFFKNCFGGSKKFDQVIRDKSAELVCEALKQLAEQGIVMDQKETLLSINRKKFLRQCPSNRVRSTMDLLCWPAEIACYAILQSVEISYNRDNKIFKAFMRTCGEITTLNKLFWWSSIYKSMEKVARNEPIDRIYLSNCDLADRAGAFLAVAVIMNSKTLNEAKRLYRIPMDRDIKLVVDEQLFYLVGEDLTNAITC